MVHRKTINKILRGFLPKADSELVQELALKAESEINACEEPCGRQLGRSIIRNLIFQEEMFELGLVSHPSGSYRHGS